MNKFALSSTLSLLFIFGSTLAEETKQSSGDPKIFAAKMLKLYKAKDIKSVLAHSTMGPATPRMLQRFAPGSSRYNSLFGEESWRWKAVQAWNDKFGKVKYRRTAHVQFTQLGGSGEAGFVTMVMEKNSWKFEAINHGKTASFAPPIVKLSSQNSLRPALLKAATSVLKAHQKQDLNAVLKLSGAEGPVALDYIREEDKGKSKPELLFSKANMQGITDWDGKFRAIYLNEMARVEFGREASEVYVVTTVRDDKGWKFEDIHSPDIEDFESMND